MLSLLLILSLGGEVRAPNSAAVPELPIGRVRQVQVSACTPTTCVAAGKNCGSLSDGCGGTLSCGSCTSPQYCSSNVCTDPQLSFATASGVGMGAECACADITTAQAGAVTLTRGSDGWCTAGSTTVIAANSMAKCTSNKPRAMKGGDGTGPIGLLTENTAQNVLLQSDDLSNAAWTSGNVGISDPTVTGNYADGPGAPGNLEATRLQIPACPTTGTLSVRYQAGGTSTTFTDSCHLKSTAGAGAQSVSIVMYDGLAAAGTGLQVVLNETTWVRPFVSRNVTSHNFEIGCWNAPLLATPSADTGAADILAWGCDSVSGTQHTSHISTAGAAATRSADTATMAYTATGGTLSMSATVIEPFTILSGKSNVSLVFDANNRLRLNNTSSGATSALNFTTTIASSSDTVASVATFAAAATAAIAGYYDGTNKSSCVGGVCVQSAQVLTLPTGAALVYVGNGSTASTFANDAVTKSVCVDPTHCPSYGL